MLSIALASLLIAAGAEAPAPAASAPLWGKLEPGPYAVGFRQWQRYDRGRAYRYPRRLDGTPRGGELGRPIQMNIWYPVEKSATGALLQPLRGRLSGPMTMGDYLDMIPTETRFGAVTATARENAEATFIQNTIPEALTPDIRKRLRPLKGRAFRDAPPARGPFPLIVYSLFSAAMSPASAEYLASQGYVVVMMPRIPLQSGMPDTLQSANDIDAKVRDMDFLISAMGEFPSADIRNIGVTGFSAGGWWGLSEAMRNPSVRALVSLDTVMLFDDEAKKAWKTLPYFNLDAVRAPVLHLIRKEWVPREDQKMWEAMRFSDRTSLQFQDPALVHWDFQSAAYALLQAGAREKAAAAIESTFLLFNRYTLAFFDAHLRGDAKAREWLGRDPEANGAPAGFVVAATRKAETGPLTEAEYFGALEEDGAAALIAAYRESWTRLGKPPLPEALVNLAGYGVLLQGRQDEAVKLFELNVEAFPSSANAYDSLGDACLAAGDTKRAKELAERTLAALDADAGLTPERKKLIRDAAEDKLRRLR